MKYLFILVFYSFSVSAIAQDIDAQNTVSWQYSKTTDDFTDEITDMALVIAKGGIGAGFISILCKNGDYFEYKANANVYIGDDVAYINNFEYRIDKLQSKKMLLKGHKNILYQNDFDSIFIKDLMKGGNNLIIKATGYDFETGTAKFTMKGAAEAVGKVMDSCKAKLGAK